MTYDVLEHQNTNSTINKSLVSEYSYNWDTEIRRIGKKSNESDGLENEIDEDVWTYDLILTELSNESIQYSSEQLKRS